LFNTPVLLEINFLFKLPAFSFRAMVLAADHFVHAGGEAKDCSVVACS
jgi:hypothetical protein